MATNEIKLAKLEHLRMVAEKTNEEVTALSEKVEKLALKGGEPNKLEGVKVNGAELNIVDKMVDILIKAGSENGTLSVNETKIAITGLQALAYKSKISDADLEAALKTKIDSIVSTSDFNSVKTAVETLVNSDNNKSVREIAGLVVAEIVAGADQNYNTLKEISDWIIKHQPEATGMRSDITDNTANITKLTKLIGELPKDTSSQNVVEYISEAIGKIDLTKYAEKTALDGLIKKADLSATVTGNGNVVSSVAYDSATSTFIATKGIIAFTEADVATDEEVEAMLAEVFAS